MLAALRFGALGLFLSLAFGCQSIRVYTDWDPEISLMSLSRFAWLEPPEAEGASPFADNSLLRKRLRIALHNVLAARGYRKVETPEEADFLVTYSVILEDRIRVDGSYSSGYGGYRRHGYGTSYASANFRNYQDSTLLIDLLDPKSQDLIWRGWGSGMLPTRDRKPNERRLNSGVRQILNRFPPDPFEAQ
jgi:hypothetical protein